MKEKVKEKIFKYLCLCFLFFIFDFWFSMKVALIHDFLTSTKVLHWYFEEYRRGELKIA